MAATIGEERTLPEEMDKSRDEYLLEDNILIL